MVLHPFKTSSSVRPNPVWVLYCWKTFLYFDVIVFTLDFAFSPVQESSCLVKLIIPFVHKLGQRFESISFGNVRPANHRLTLSSGSLDDVEVCWNLQPIQNAVQLWLCCIQTCCFQFNHFLNQSRISKPEKKVAQIFRVRLKICHEKLRNLMCGKKKSET